MGSVLSHREQLVKLEEMWESEKCNTEELIPGKAFYVRHLLSGEECKRFRDLMELNSEKVEELGSSEESYQYRKRLVCPQQVAMDQLWSRLQGVMEVEGLLQLKGLNGRDWTAMGLNEMVRVARYRLPDLWEFSQWTVKVLKCQIGTGSEAGLPLTATAASPGVLTRGPGGRWVYSLHWLSNIWKYFQKVNDWKYFQVEHLKIFPRWTCTWTQCQRRQRVQLSSFPSRIIAYLWHIIAYFKYGISLAYHGIFPGRTMGSRFNPRRELPLSSSRCLQSSDTQRAQMITKSAKMWRSNTELSATGVNANQFIETSSIVIVCSSKIWDSSSMIYLPRGSLSNFKTSTLLWRQEVWFMWQKHSLAAKSAARRSTAAGRREMAA